MKKWWNIVGMGAQYLFFAFAVVIMIFTVVTAFSFSKEDGKGPFGYSFFIVLSDSMSKTAFASGDIVVSKRVEPAVLQEGDIITFRSIDPDSYDEVVTHQIRQKTLHEGQEAFVTYGTTTDADDAYPALASKVIGQYCFRIPKAGYFFQFLKTPLGYFTLVFTPFFILIIAEAIRFYRLLRKLRRQECAELNMQKIRLAAKEAEADRKIKEMQAMMQQMKQNQMQGGVAHERE